jgi:hypothetical protein
VNTVRDLIDALADEPGYPSSVTRLVVETPDGVGFIQGVESGTDEDGPFVVLVVGP